MVSKEKQEALQKKLKLFNIHKIDVIEKFVRSQGHGGQNLNKTATCVYLKHVPSGIEVKCQETRSQALNRFLAWRRLAEHIEVIRLGSKSAHAKRIQKIKKQKKKRRKRAKSKSKFQILQNSK